jgi:hypothetical protein
MQILMSKLIIEINEKHDIFDETLNITISKKKYGKIRITNNVNNICFNFMDCIIPHSHNNKEQKECCVCYDKTTNMSSCNHSICIKCRNQILNIYNKFNCPLCRKSEAFNKGKTLEIPLKVIKVLIL